MRLSKILVSSIFIYSFGCSQEKFEQPATKINQVTEENVALTCPKPTQLIDGLCLGKASESETGLCPVGTFQHNEQCQGLPVIKKIMSSDQEDIQEKSLESSSVYGSLWKGNIFDDFDDNEDLHWNVSTVNDIHWFFQERLLGFRVEARFINNQSSVRYSMELTDNNERCPMWFPELKIDRETGIFSGTPFKFSRGSYEVENTAQCEVKVTATAGEEEITSNLKIILGECKNCKIANKFAILNYSPYREGQTPLPDADGNIISATITEIEEDLRELKNLTNNIRTYEVDENVLDTASKYNMGVHLGCYLVAEQGAGYTQEQLEKNMENNLKSLDKIIEAANNPKYHKTIKSLIIGNEIKLHNYMTEGRLLEHIKYVQEKIGRKFPVTTALLLGPGTYGQLGPSDYFGSQLDYILYHHYPFWEKMDVRQSKHSIKMGYKYMRYRFPDKDIALGETGWATEGATYMTADTSELHQAIYINDLFYEVNNSFDPEIKKLGNRIMYFQAFDEPWKIANNEGGTLAAHWGIYDKNRKPKLFLRTAFPDLYPNN